VTIDQIIHSVLDEEGGIKDVGDGKGVTRFGQTPQWLSDNGFKPPETRDEAGINYAVWMGRTKLMRVCERDWYVGWLVTDFSVHGGEHAAARILQKALNVPADGIIGPKTLAAIPVDSVKFRRKLLAAFNTNYYRLLGSKQVDRRESAGGWGNRIARKIEALP
jgi:lysozyme family protein